MHIRASRGEEKCLCGKGNYQIGCQVSCRGSFVRLTIPRVAGDKAQSGGKKLQGRGGDSSAEKKTRTTRLLTVKYLASNAVGRSKARRGRGDATMVGFCLVLALVPVVPVKL